MKPEEIRKSYTIRGNASRIILKVWSDKWGDDVNFYCIFDTRQEAEKILAEVGDGMWHIEEEF